MTKTIFSILTIVFSFALGHSQNKSSLFDSDIIANPSFNYKPFASKEKKSNPFSLTTPPSTLEETSPTEQTYSILIVEPKGYFFIPNYHTENKTKRSLIVIAPK